MAYLHPYTTTPFQCVWQTFARIFDTMMDSRTDVTGQNILLLLELHHESQQVLITKPFQWRLMSKMGFLAPENKAAVQVTIFIPASLLTKASFARHRLLPRTDEANN